MTREPQDHLDRLTRALHEAEPVPDPEARRKAVSAAMEKFDEFHQGSADPARPNQDHLRMSAGFLKGVRRVFSTFTNKPVLAATTSTAALCLGLFVVMPQLQTRPPALSDHSITTDTVAPEQPATDTALTRQRESLANTLEANISTPRSAPSPAGQTMPANVTTSPEAAESQAVADMAAEEPAMNSAPTSNLRPPSLAERSESATGDFTIGFAPPSELIVAPQVSNTEAFANAAANPVKVAAEEPVSTFSADVDTASYAVVRSSLMAGALPPADAVRIEEMVNYFPYDYPAPDADGAPFRASISTMQTPWNPDTRLVRIGLQGRMPAMAERPPLNLVFLIDTSGSMQDANKLPLLKRSLRLMLDQLRPEDQVAIVTYAGSAGEVLAPTPASDSAAILSALERLDADGSTAGAEGLEQAYRTAAAMAGNGEVSRIFLATDGDFNVGISDTDALTDFIARKRDEGAYLSVLGFGRGNLDDATMQALAQNGNGQAAYIDTLQEARKVLVDQLSGALFSIAGDVKIQVEWNPAEVAEYRLIGYETRALAREDFNNDKVDAGELGAGHTVTALYEVTAPDSPALLNDPLRYGADAGPAETAAELGFLRLRYKEPGETTSQLIETPIPSDSAATDDDARFAASIAGFGQLLTGGKYLGDWGWDEAIALASESRGEDAFGYRTEAVSLMRLAKALSGE